MSKIYISAIVLLLSEILPALGVTIGSDKLTDVVQAIIVLVTGVIILVARYKQGDINILGAKN
jgi:uncharacterized membrane protein